MNNVDVVFLFAFFGIWLTQIYWMFLSLGAFLYARHAARDAHQRGTMQMGSWPTVSVLIPAHNEGMVIEDTLRAIAGSDYPAGRYEILLIDDGSTDDTRAVAERVAMEYPQIRIIEVPKGQGGKGKSRTLNVALPQATGELIAVYDADNTPEPDCLRRLVAALCSNPRLVAVNGKVRTRNWADSWLTRFIHLEFIYFQWMFQAGRWYWFKLCTLMGTNYVIQREALEAMGGFDERSLVDDTEMSLRIFLGQRRIQWIPDAVTWEQEPSTLSVWFRQRTRWAQGNLYVTAKYLPKAASHPFPIGLEMLNSLLNYAIFLPALLLSDLVLVLGVSGFGHMSIFGPYAVMWPVIFFCYIAQFWFALAHEERRPSMYLLAVASYFTYAVLFVPVVIVAAFKNIQSGLLKSEIKWVKTIRTEEKKTP